MLLETIECHIDRKSIFLSCVQQASKQTESTIIEGKQESKQLIDRLTSYFFLLALSLSLSLSYVQSSRFIDQTEKKRKRINCFVFFIAINLCEFTGF